VNGIARKSAESRRAFRALNLDAGAGKQKLRTIPAVPPRQCSSGLQAESGTLADRRNYLKLLFTVTHPAGHCDAAAGDNWQPETRRKRH